jgi:hypothetical protein
VVGGLVEGFLRVVELVVVGREVAHAAAHH